VLDVPFVGLCLAGSEACEGVLEVPFVGVSLAGSGACDGAITDSIADGDMLYLLERDVEWTSLEKCKLISRGTRRGCGKRDCVTGRCGAPEWTAS
jgi:hypothetical protein